MPTIDIPDKICPHCGGIRWYKNVIKNKYITYYCSVKRNESKSNSEKLFPEKKKERRHQYYINNRKEEIQKHLEWKKNNRNKVNILNKKYLKEKIDNLNDSYVKLTIIKRSNLKCSEIPQELIELQKEKLIFFRKIKQLKNGKET